jgi:hypothetical protein
LKRQLLFFAFLAIPVVCFAVHRPILFSFAGVAAAGAWWAASPVSYPRWIVQGLARAVPLAAAEALALWWLKG